MDREKMMTLVLLDLCAFAYAQDGGERARRDFEAACRLAEAQSLPDTDVFRDLVDRQEKDPVNQDSAQPVFQGI